MISLVRHQQTNGDEPLSDGLNGASDKMAQARIRIRLRKVEAGNFGDCEAVGEDVSERRVHVGAGYRVYALTFGDIGKPSTCFCAAATNARKPTTSSARNCFGQTGKAGSNAKNQSQRIAPRTRN